MSKRRRQVGQAKTVQPNESALREQLSVAESNAELWQESLREALADSHLYSLQQEDVGWLKLGADTSGYLTDQEITGYRRLSRWAYLRDPLVNRAVSIQASYVFAQGCSFKARDKAVDEVVQAHVNDPANQVALYSHEEQMLRETDLQVDGEIFFVFFASPDGQVKIRTINPDEITEVICDPEDSRAPWWYRRVWSERSVDGGIKTRTALYPDWGKPDDAPEPSGGAQSASIEETPVYHVKVGGLGSMLRGVPETLQALDWAKAYTLFLADRATVARALARFTWKVKAQGGARGLAAAKTKLNTTLGTTSSDTNPPPTTGAAFTYLEGSDLDPVRTGGATINPDEGRRFLLMVAAAVGLPETFFGDASVGSLATAQSLDRPTELKFLGRQKLWNSIYGRIFDYVIERNVEAGNLAQDVDRYTDNDWPPLIEHDPEKRLQAIVSLTTLNGQQWSDTIDYETWIRLVLTTLGEDDIEELVPRMVKGREIAIAANQAREDETSIRKEQARAFGAAQARQGGQQVPQLPAGQQGQGQPPTATTEAKRPAEPTELTLPDPDDDAAWTALEDESDKRLEGEGK